MLETARSVVSYYKGRFRDDDLRSSLSDNDAYPAFCEQAAIDDDIFVNFRNAPGYSEILEHVSYGLGKRYLRTLRHDAALLAAAREICASDNLGSPRCYHYPHVGMASPTTLRYLKVTKDLGDYFGSLTGMNIVEIGVGYGGQCRVLSSHYRPASYSLVDLPPVLKLTERYLTEMSVDAPTRFISAHDAPETESDLVISNYAFSELRREAQEMYMSRIVDKARRGYMTFNKITPASFGSMTAEELAERVGGTLLPERPLSFPGNRIIVWTRQGSAPSKSSSNS